MLNVADVLFPHEASKPRVLDFSEILIYIHRNTCSNDLIVQIVDIVREGGLDGVEDIILFQVLSHNQS